MLYETLVIARNILDSFPSSECADTFDEIEAKKECDKWVHEGGTYLTWKKDWKKDWKKVVGGMQRKWKIKRVSKRVCQMDQLSN